MGIYLFKVKGRITKTICNSVFIANFAESQNKAIAISITDHAKRLWDLKSEVYGRLNNVLWRLTEVS